MCRLHIAWGYRSIVLPSFCVGVGRFLYPIPPPCLHIPATQPATSAPSVADLRVRAQSSDTKTPLCVSRSPHFVEEFTREKATRFLSTTMAPRMELAVILLCVLTTAMAQQWRPRKAVIPADCTTCDRDACVRPSGCVAGVMKDRCDCCDVCAKAEFELCDHPDVSQDGELGECGDKLECRVRDDLEVGGM